MKKLLTLVLALGLVLSMVASASALTIAFSQIGQESDWRTANTDSVTAAIEGHEGWEFVYSDGQQKQENQIQALRNFITQGVDYILFTGVVTSGWDEVLTEVNEAEIPLILLDRIPDCADKIEYKAAFGGDFPLEGRRQIQWAAKYLESIGKTEDVKVAIMEGTTGSDAQVGRTEGNLAALADYPWMEVVGQQTGNFTRAEGQALMESWLKSIEKIDVLIAQNDDMALGAIDAIKAAGLVPGKDIIIVGCDSVKAAFEAIVAGAARRELVFADRFPFLYFVRAYGLDYLAAFPSCTADTEPTPQTIMGLIDRVGGLADALACLHRRIGGEA